VSRPAVGVIWHEELHPLAGDPAVEVWEIEPQTLWRVGGLGEPRYVVPEELGALPHLLGGPLVVHGVGFPVGGARAPDPAHEPALRASADAVSAPWVSEHMAFNAVERDRAAYNASFLHAPVCTEEAVKIAAARLRRLREVVGRPVAFENPVSYLPRQPWEMLDGEFLRAVAEEADALVLLDLHNAWCNERNGRGSIEALLRALPVDRVVEVHVAGGMDRGGYWLDAHSGAVPREVLQQLPGVVARCPQLQAVVFEILPWFVRRDGVAAVGPMIRDVHEALAARPGLTGAGDPAWQRRGSPVDCAAWEDAVAWLGLGRAPESELEQELSRLPGMRVVRELIWSFRAGRVAAAFPRATRRLRAMVGESAARDVLDGFFAATLPELFPEHGLRQFAEHLAASGPALAEVHALALVELEEG
jgi:uncharacterized protein (UPF0276 family)